MNAIRRLGLTDEAAARVERKAATENQLSSATNDALAEEFQPSVAPPDPCGLRAMQAKWQEASELFDLPESPHPFFPSDRAAATTSRLSCGRNGCRDRASPVVARVVSRASPRLQGQASASREHHQSSPPRGRRPAVDPLLSPASSVRSLGIDRGDHGCLTPTTTLFRQLVEAGAFEKSIGRFVRSKLGIAGECSLSTLARLAPPQECF